MRTVSERFAAAIESSYALAAEARVLTPTGSQPIDILGGNVTLDGQADSRGRLDLTVPSEFAPLVSTDPLAPYGNEIAVARGIQFDDGTRELVPLGVYRIETAEMSSGDAPVSVSGVDRSIRFSEVAFETTFNPPDTNIGGFIAALAQGLYPGVQMRFATVANTVPAQLVISEGDTPWEVMTVLAMACGCALYFDNEGILTLTPLPTGLSPAVAEVREGGDGTLMSASRSWTRDDAINRVVVTSSNSANNQRYRGEAIDDSPSSPTRYGGPFGRKTYTYEDTYGAFQSDAACRDSARAILSKHLGLTASVSFDALVNPAIEPLDVVTVRCDDIGVNEKHLIDSITIPLGPDGTMSAQTRAALQETA